MLQPFAAVYILEQPLHIYSVRNNMRLHNTCVIFTSLIFYLTQSTHVYLFL